jgi:hypothetical protein
MDIVVIKFAKSLRLFFEFLALISLLLSLAYHWQSNTFHEWLGTCLLLLILIHNFRQWRWYQRQIRYLQDCKLTAMVIHCSTFAAFTTLIATSLMISREVFVFFPFEESLVIRDIHLMSAWWFVCILGIHLGYQGQKLLALTLHRLLDEGIVRQTLKIFLQLIIIISGFIGTVKLNLGNNLIGDFNFFLWDFENEVSHFFISVIALIGLIAIFTHYVGVLLKNICKQSTLDN